MSAQTQAAELLDQAAAHLLEHIDTLAADVAEACATWAAEPNIPSAFEAGVRGVACPKSRHRDVSRSRWRPTDSEALEGLDRNQWELFTWGGTDPGPPSGPLVSSVCSRDDYP
jgi:hypothetical protein